MIGQHAVVIGASMAGLLAARAVADYYEQVTLIERDKLSSIPEPRKGVPQSHQPHFLLAHGGEVLESLFPGIMDELVANGACEGDTDALLIFQEGGYLCRFKTGVRGLTQSRALIEFIVRQRLLSLPNVRVIQNCDALGLMTNADRSRVTGVHIIRRDAGSADEQLQADLVIDAAGRGSHIIDWLAELGYSKPQEEKLHVDIVYTSRLYRRQPDYLSDLNTILITPTPEQRRGGVIMAQEDDAWRVLIFGYLGDRAPLDDDGFLAYAHSLPAPDLYNLIRVSEPLSEPKQYRFTESLRRHYEKVTRFPDGLLVIGDALCSFNPVYGQGMTVSALEAQALHNCLSMGLNELWERFFKATGQIIDNAWEVATGSDLQIPQIEGNRSPKVRFANWYMSKLVKAAQYDPVATMAFYNVLNFKAAPPSVMHPRVALRVLWTHLQKS